MATRKRVVAYLPGMVLSAPGKSAAAATLKDGVLVTLNSDGELLLADYRASASAGPARGVAIQDMQLKDPRGNVLDVTPSGGRVSYVMDARVDGFTGLTPGATLYLFSGGLVTESDPAASPGDVTQVVGFAESETLAVIRIGDPIVSS